LKDVNLSAFKLSINKDVLKRIADAIHKVHPVFDRKAFVATAPALDSLELKARVQFVRDRLQEFLPPSYPQALKILLASLKSGGLSGFALWPYTEFVQTFGLGDLSLSLAALQKMTVLFTGEFAVRPFLIEHPQETLKFLTAAARSPSVDVRRWASEGTRPRLPWGARLGDFVRDPSPTLPILEILRFDSELYVRKSVSNHLNDIAKDHPEVVLKVLKRWQTEAGADDRKKVTWIIHRSLRTLIKQGHPGALKLIGVDHQAQAQVKNLKLDKKSYKLNERIEFSFVLKSTAKKPQKLVIDYVIHHRKSNKETTPKVFKLKTFTLAGKAMAEIRKAHSLKVITTRKYYPGVHFLEIQVNGKIYARAEWNLKI
jgi:3-methyladenine DNA glycosylase AlkC